jgi:hypothetical protein
MGFRLNARYDRYAGLGRNAPPGTRKRDGVNAGGDRDSVSARRAREVPGDRCIIGTTDFYLDGGKFRAGLGILDYSSDSAVLSDQ